MRVVLLSSERVIVKTWFSIVIDSSLSLTHTVTEKSELARTVYIILTPTGKAVKTSKSGLISLETLEVRTMLRSVIEKVTLT